MKKCVGIMMTMVLMLGMLLAVSAKSKLEVFNLEDDTNDFLFGLGFDEQEMILIPESEIEEYQRAVRVYKEEKYFQVKVSTSSINDTSELTKEQFEQKNAKNCLAGNFDKYGYVKMKMMVFLLPDGDYKITSNVTWVKKPANIKTDILSVYTDSGVLQGKSPIYNYSCEKNIYVDGELQNTVITKKDRLNENISLVRTSAGCELERYLKKNMLQYTPMKNGEEFSNHGLYLSFKVTPEDDDNMTIYEKLSYDKGAEGISFSVTLNKETGDIVSDYR